MKKIQRQIELQLSNLHVREGDENGRTVEGYAIVFGVRSNNLVPWSSWREVYEIMEPGSITQDLLNRSDVVLTAFHDNSAILGRWRQGKGTLSLSLDIRGLKIACTLAETERVNELLSGIKRGDISGMSFAFTANEEDSENGVSYEKTAVRTEEGKEVWIRHVKQVTGLYDVTIAGHPAYEQTTIEAREQIDKFFDKHCPKEETEEERLEREKAEAAAKQKEAEDREAKEKAEREQKEREAAAVSHMRKLRLSLTEDDTDIF